MSLRQSNHELEILLHFSTLLTEHLNDEELGQVIVDHVVDTLSNAEAATLWLVDEERNEMILRTCSGHGDAELEGLSLTLEAGSNEPCSE